METKTTPIPIPPAEDLVEVKKPTSLLVAQFFLFPLIIIAICVGIFLLFGYLTYEQRGPIEYLNDIQSRFHRIRTLKIPVWSIVLSRFTATRKRTTRGFAAFWQ